MNWKKTIDLIGWPRIIIGFFLLSTYCIAPFVGIPLFVAFRDTFTRFGMNAILVLSLMPMIEAGAGLNFGMPLGIDRKSTRLNSSHANISYAVFCLKKKKLPHAVHDYLGEPPTLTFEKTTLRKPEPSVAGAWPQASHFLGSVRALNLRR